MELRGRRVRALARVLVAIVIAPILISVVSFAIDAVRQVFALPACTLNTHYTRTLTNGGLPIVYRFTSDCTWTVPSGAGKGDIMVVGGGGGGGSDGGSGGGGGEMRTGTSVTVGSSIDIDIGAGGVGGAWGTYGGYTSRGSSNGSDTTLTWSSSVQYRAIGGSGGGGWSSTGPPGGSGGTGGSGGSGSPGGAGGAGPYSTCNYVGYGADGSAGPRSSITGTLTYYAAGGGGGLGVTSNNGTNGYSGDVGSRNGGWGGGGQGAWYSSSAKRAYNASSGDANTGSGGGGGVACDSQGYGGAGVERSGTSGNDPRGLNGPGQRTMGGDGGSGVFYFKVGAAPSIGTQPTASTVSHGSTASFSVSASVSYSEVLTYQWQKAESTATSTWGNISGATAASYSTAATSISTDSGDLYRVVVTSTVDGVTSTTTSNSATLTVNRADQTISFTGPSNQAWSATPITLSATASSGLTVSFSSSTTSVCTVSGTTLTLVASGTCTVVASQSGNTNYNAASNVSQSFTVSSTGRSGFSGNGTIGANGTKYVVQQFTSTGSTTWTAPQGVTAIDLLVVGGGGGGGSRGAGGGGAGGMATTTGYAVTSGNTYTVTVGAGGAGGRSSVQESGSAGSASSFLLSGTGLTANGGAGGFRHGVSSASGGASGSATGTGALSSNAGGTGKESGTCGSTSDWCGGGGGGTGAAGGNASTSGGVGGNGQTSTITGQSTTYGGGGGGGGGDSSIPSSSPAPGGSGGSGGGGAGASPTWNSSTSTCTPGDGSNGTANTGGGGGGSGYCSASPSDRNGTGGNGGSGIVVLRYVLPSASVPDLATASDSGSNTSDNITTTRTVTFTGSAPVGASVQISYATASSMSDADISSGTWTNTGSACTADSSSGAWSCTTTQLDPGVYKFRSTSTTTLDGVTDTQTSTTALPITIDTTAPTVSSVGFTSSAGVDNTYKSGDTVSVTVVFSEAVTVTGTPRIALAGLTSKYATYASGSGTTSIVFSYTVASGDTDADGLAITGNTLELNSGTIVDAAGNAATLTHSAVTTQSAHKVDTTTPTVSNVTSSTVNGTIYSGSSVSIQITFTEAVTVTGTPQLTLETGATDRAVDYVSGSGTTSLTFTYTVQSTDTSGDLDYASTSALALNGGTIVDAAGNNATLTLAAPGAVTSLGANKALVIVSAPTKVVSVRTPVGTASGAAFTTQPQVSLQDVGSRVVGNDNATVITATVSAGASLVGTTTATVFSGIATFTNLGISGTSGTAYTITYSASYGGSALTVATQSVTPTVGAATQLAVSRSAAGSAYGSAFTTQPIVEVRDSGGNKVTSASNVVTATVSSGSLVGSGTATASSGVATFSGLGVTATPGTVTITYSATGLASTTQTIAVAQGANTISFTNPGTKTWSAATFGLTVTATSGDTPSVTSSTTSVCTVAGTTVTMVGSGSCSLTASEDGNTNYAAASDVSVSFTINKATQTITFAAMSTQTWSATPITISPTSSSGLTVTVSSSNTAICSVSGFSVTMVASGTCTLTASQSGDARYSAATSVDRSFSITSNGSGRTGYTGNGTVGENGTKYVVQQFTTTGSTSWVAPVGVSSIDYLVVGGGASGTRGYCSYLWGHGGGGGGVSTGSVSVTGGSTYTVTVGAGGSGATQNCAVSHTGSNGETSSLATGGSTVVSATGGRTGFSSPYSWTTSQTIGGTSGTGMRGGTNYSYAGGNGGGGAYGCGAPGYCGAGGGGGAGGAGSVLNGGIGVSSNLTGSSVMYGSGGSGKNGNGFGTYYSASGTSTSGTSRTGTANTGQGGTDGMDGNYTAGGSGIVVIRYAIVAPSTPDLDSTYDSAGSSNVDDITSARTLTLTGSAPIGATVQLSYATASSMSDMDSSAGSWSDTGLACTADSSTGAWSCTTAQLDPGVYKFRSTATSAFDGVTDTQTSASALPVTIDTTAPTVSSVAFSSDAGTDSLYKVGDVVSVTVGFSEAVVVSGSPRIPLVGLSSKYATYVSGSGTTSLVFSYTVVSGDVDSDGLGILANALELNSGTITDIAGSAATLTHSAVSTQSAHKVDGNVPTVSNVTSSTGDGTVAVGGTVSIQVTFTEVVTVSGTPQLTLETGSTDRAVNYSSGSGTNTLTFVYTVQAGDSSTDLDYSSTSALALNGGSIVDAAGNGATLTLASPGAVTSLSANKALVVTSAPTKVVSVRTPVGTASGAAFSTQPQVSLQDVGSNVVTGDSSTVVTATVSSGATLVGTTTATAVNGVATFNNLGISGTAGTPYTITYSASYGGSALTSATQSVTPTVGSAMQLSVTAQPVGAGAGAALGTQPVVNVLDSGGNLVTTSSASIVVSASGGTLGGTTTISASSGIATFTNLTFAGTISMNYTLSFASTGLTSATSSNFTVNVGAATQLVLTTSAAGSAYGSAFTTQPVVEIRDAGGNKVTTATNLVTASLSSGTVVGTGNTTAVAGVATFDGLGITATPGSVTVTYSATGLTSTSESITVAKGTNTISFTDPGTKTWSSSTFDVTVSATSGDNPTVTSSTTAVCTVSGATVTMVKAGSCSLTAAEDGNTNYDAASGVTRTFTINKASQTISFTSPGDQTYSATPISLTFSASSGLTPVVTSGDTSVCTVSVASLSLVSSGSCALTANQAGDDRYAAATAVVNTITISKATPSLSSMSAQSKTYGESSFTPTAPTASYQSASVPGSVGYASSDTSVATVGASTGAVTITGAGSATITATFTPSDTGKFNSATTTYVVTVDKATQSISFTSPGNQTYSTSTVALSVLTSSGLTPTVTSGNASVCSVASFTLTLVSSGSCVLTATQAGNANYEAASSVSHTFTISRASSSLSGFADVTKTYGEDDFTIVAPTSSVAGTIAYTSSNSSVASVSGTTIDVGAAGTATITATLTPTESDKYASSTTTMTITVNKANPTLGTFAAVTKYYGDPTFGLTAPIASVPGSFDYASSNTSVASVTGSVVTVVAPGTTTITATFTPTDSSNYEVVSTTMTLTVNKALQTISFTSPGDRTYSANTITLSFSASSGLTPTVTAGDTSICDVSGTTLTLISSGSCVLTATQAGNANYAAATSVVHTITISKATPTMSSMSAESKTYGDPSFTPTTPTVTYESASVGGSIAYTSSNTSVASVNASSGAVTIAGAGSATITASFTPSDTGKFNAVSTTYGVTVAKADQAALSVTSISGTYGSGLTLTTSGGTTGGSKSYAVSDVTATGCAVTAGVLSVTGAGTCSVTATMAGNDNYNPVSSSATTVTFAKADQAALTVTSTTGVYGSATTLTVSGGSTSGLVSYVVSGTGCSITSGALSKTSIGTCSVTATMAGNNNYNPVSSSATTVTFDPRPITVTADVKSKEYGTSDPDLTWSVTSGSLVGSDELSGSLTRASGSTVGTYAISQGTLDNANYDITYVGANLTITTRPITVTPATQEKQYGASDPSFNYTITSGSLVSGDSLIGSLSRESGSSVGTYAITVGTLANSNYAITVAPANLTITTRPITLTADAKTITYGDSEPNLTYSVTVGSVVGSDTFSGSLVRVSGTNAGTYTISRGTLANSNYAISFVNGTLTINKASQAALTMTTTSVVYGTSTVLGSSGGSGDGAVSYSVTSEGTAGCSLVGATLSTTGGVGTTCTVTATKAASTNYNQVSSSATTITVASRAITITAVAATKRYSQNDPELTYTITSGALAGSDTLTGSLTRASGEDVGTYAISQGTLTNSNYTITYVGANLTIEGRLITVTASTRTKAYGDADPSLGYTITSGSLHGSDVLMGSLTRATGENVGTYSITQGTLTNSNYSITFVPGSFTITGAAQSGFTVSAGSMSVTYGGTTTLSTTGGDGDGVVTYSAVDGTGSCSISGSTLTATGAGTCEVTATKAAEGNYLEATSNTITITVTKANQTITFADPADRNFSTTTFTLAPTASSGLEVTLTSTTMGVCTVDGFTVTMVFSGTCSLTASRAESANYNAATDVTQSFEIAAVLPYAPTITQLTASDRAISVLFSAGNSGGSALTNHEYSTDNGVTWIAWPVGSTTSPLNIAGLTNGVEYQVKIRAINAIGTGSESNMLAVTPVAPVVLVGPTTTTIDPTTTTSTIIESTTTTIFTTTTVTLAPDRRQTTTTISRRAITTTTITRGGQTTTTTRATTTTSSTTTTLIERIPPGVRRPSPSTTVSGVIIRPQTPSTNAPTTSTTGSQTPTSVRTPTGVIVRPQTPTTSASVSTTASTFVATTTSIAGSERVTIRPQSDSTVAPATSATTAPALAPLVPEVTTIESTTTTVFVPATVPAKLTPAVGASVVAGEVANIVWSQVEQVQMKVEVGGSTLMMAAISSAGERQPLLPNGSLVYVPGSTTRVDGSGMLAGSKVEVWMHSTPTLLGVATVGDDGGFAQVFQVPAVLEHGSHKLQVVGLSPAGEEMVVALGVTVTDQATVDRARAGEMSVTEADMLAHPGVVGLSTMSDGAANNVILLLILLALLLVAVSFDRLVVVPRRKSFAQRLAGATPWLVQAPAVRATVHGLGFLVGLGALVSTDGQATAPTTLWLGLLVVLGILDSIGALVALATWAGVLVATGRVNSFTELSVVALVGALALLPLASAEILRPRGNGRSERVGTLAQVVVSATMASLMTVVLTWILVAGSDVRFAAASFVTELGVAAAFASIARFVLTTRLNAPALRFPREVPVAYFGAIVFVVAIAHVSVKPEASNILGLGVIAALIAVSTGSFRVVLAPRALTRLAVVGLIALTASSGAISFGNDDVEEIVLEQDATAIDSMKIIGQTSAFIDGVPHVFVAGSIRQGEVVYVNGAVGMTLTIASVQPDGDMTPLTADGTIQLIRGHSVSITATGFAPDQDVNAWLFSDPILLGNTKTNGKGTVRDSFVVPPVTPNGDHTLQIRLLSTDGKIVNFGLPVVVVDNVADGGA